ncbi:MAG TPA: sugar transferase [Solirubrobacteraceae bacterium]|nr:sugar transferase [Solirubrobacteraceae bacterium]
MGMTGIQSGEGAAVAALDGAAKRAAGDELAGQETTRLRVVQGGRSLPLGVRLRRSAGEIGRRLVEGTAATLLLLLLSPVLLAATLAIRVDSGGPALFRQRRLGRGRREFTVFKFRTMHTGADTAPHREYVKSLIEGDRGPKHGQLYKLSVDDRVTPVGRFLRSWSLDELPQLINVLRGDMAFVGPRPVIPYEAEIYPPQYLRRFDVRPGLTGLWQVSGRNERSYQEMVRLDIDYAANHSAWRDLRILLKTVPVVLRRQGVA